MTISPLLVVRFARDNEADDIMWYKNAVCLLLELFIVMVMDLFNF